MPNYLFRLGSPDGQIIERRIEAVDLSTAKDEVARQGFHVFQVRKSGFSFVDLLPGRKVISTERFLLFNQELLALVRAGLPVIQSFDIMLERQKNLRFKQVLTEIRDKVRSGVAISDAFASYGRIFPPIYSTSIRAGERAGDLEGVLRRFLKYQKTIVTLRKKVVGALIYPAILVTLSVAMVFVMLTFVIPKFAEFYQGFGAELPVVTRVVIALSALIRHNIILVLAAVAAIAFVVHRWSRTATGGATFDRLLLRVPIAGGILHRFAILQFTQSLATLLGGGTPMVPAMEMASTSISNRYVAGRVESIVKNVREGEPLWSSLDHTGVMSDLAVEMIKVGESTGALLEMLANVSEFYDEEIDSRLSRMIAMLEPIILVGLGIVIALLLYAFYLPLFRLSSVQQ
ncbi:MAG: type II secretion system F family protein [Acidobacteriota bacterium]